MAGIFANHALTFDNAFLKLKQANYLLEQIFADTMHLKISIGLVFCWSFLGGMP
ncbi:MAG: hypothetical protein ORN28_08350 [Rhodoferax sp.]|nr:hypothetical protein [Rhodoferax sp.]